MISLDEFEADAKAFLSSVAPLRTRSALAWGIGSDRVALWSDRTPDEDANLVLGAREWKAREFDSGFAWISGPPEYGGAGLPDSYRRRYEQLKRSYETPDEEPLLIGLGMIAPTILAHGTEGAKRQHLHQIHRGKEIACQLFSEPEAGSDLASLKSTARRDGDSWILQGQKVWTSGAQFSDIGEILCKTDAKASKHKGLTAFLLDMHSPGIDVRPLRQMTGGTSFNEVFIDNVRVPDDHRLGEVGEGWKVALTTLMNERASIGSGNAGGGSGTVHRLFALAQSSGPVRDQLTRHALVDVHIGLSVARWNAQRGMAKVASGQTPGPEMSLGKLSLVRNLMAIDRAATLLLGQRMCADSGDWGTYAWSQFCLGLPGVRLAGGTDEVMRNILAERVLGLPKDS